MFTLLLTHTFATKLRPSLLFLEYSFMVIMKELKSKKKEIFPKIKKIRVLNVNF